MERSDIIEDWKSIKNYEELYSISNNGQIRNRFGRFLKHSIQDDGSHQITCVKMETPKHFIFIKLLRYILYQIQKIENKWTIFYQTKT